MKAGSAVMAACLLLAAAGVVQAETTSISFKNAKDGSLKLYCEKIDGMLGAQIRCEGDLFHPGADWQVIHAEQVCFRHQDGRMRAWRREKKAMPVLMPAENVSPSPRKKDGRGWPSMTMSALKSCGGLMSSGNQNSSCSI